MTIRQETIPWFESKTFLSLQKLRPYISGCCVIAMFLFGLYLYQRDTNAANLADVAALKITQGELKHAIEEGKRERDEQITKLDNSVLKRETFEAYHKADVDRMARMEVLLDKILENK